MKEKSRQLNSFSFLFFSFRFIIVSALIECFLIIMIN